MSTQCQLNEAYLEHNGTQVIGLEPNTFYKFEAKLLKYIFIIMTKTNLKAYRSCRFGKGFEWKFCSRPGYRIRWQNKRYRNKGGFWKIVPRRVWICSTGINLIFIWMCNFYTLCVFWKNVTFFDTQSHFSENMTQKYLSTQKSWSMKLCLSRGSD